MMIESQVNFCFFIGCLKVKGGAAEAGGRLISGDQILSINGNDVSDANQEQVAEMLKVSRLSAAAVFLVVCFQLLVISEFCLCVFPVFILFFLFCFDLLTLKLGFG